MIKLYKREGNEIRYWEAWQTDSTVTVHRGVVGDTGEARDIEILPGHSGEAIIEREATEPRRRGFRELPIERHSQLVVQYRVDGWGSPEELEKRHSVEALLNETLGWTGNGHCDGGDIGSGSTNVFSFVLDPEAATAAIVEALEEGGFLDGALIAVEEGDEYKVYWPQSHSGPFSII